jgi:hypothetical protein
VENSHSSTQLPTGNSYQRYDAATVNWREESVIGVN